MSVYVFALAFLAALAGVQAGIVYREDLSVEWQTFKLKYGKVYNNEIEERFRKMIFKENWNMIVRHNTKYDKGEVSFSMAMNGFGDLLHHEFVATVNGFKRNSDERDSSNATLFILPENVEVPKSINWVKKGYVTEIKNQGSCGSCWSFSATGALEGQHKRKSGKLVDLSEQNLVDCSGKFGNEGCEGGLPSAAFQYIKANKGIDTEESYPYEGLDGKCRFKRKNIGATDTGYVDVKSGSEKRLKDAVGTVGPVSVAIDASHPSLEFYSKGIYDEPACSSEDLDHAVLAVGYGNYKGKDYWLVKNSWGAEWGEAGYVRMSRNKKNQCGIATEANYPLV